jgi:Na+/H+ antiporter NhaD/arsenite permease-like protein
MDFIQYLSKSNDSTKTITMKKSEKGSFIQPSEFRLWIVAKRFRLPRKRIGFVLIMILAILLFTRVSKANASTFDGQPVLLTVIGTILNTQESPIEAAEVRFLVGNTYHELQSDVAQENAVQSSSDGNFILEVSSLSIDFESEEISVDIQKSGYRSQRLVVDPRTIVISEGRAFVQVPDVILVRLFNPAFYLAALIFIAVFGLISFNLLHETIAAFLGASMMLGISYFFGHFDSNYWIIGFHRAITFIDFDVIFLLMTMMIFMAIMSRTGIFNWLAYRAYRLGHGNTFLVVAILVSITAMTSSVLNDTTVMLLMTPVSIQIAIALNIHPASIVVPEILASNIGGAATLIGTPPNTIIGSYVGLSFNQFLINMVPIAVLAMLLLLWMTRRLYRSEYEKVFEAPASSLVERLETGAQITDPVLLRKSLLLFGLTLILFFSADLFNMPPAVVGMIGATALLLSTRPNVSEMLGEVDWTTLVFFMSLFAMVGGIQEVGLIQVIAEGVKSIAGESLLLATVLIIWVSAIASAVVANIPFTAAIVPVTVFLSQTLPGAENNVLYWALALGAGLGGNATYIGSAPNIVAAGILDHAGYRLKFGDFTRVGVPVTFVTLLVPTIWILIRYFWLTF